MSRERIAVVTGISSGIGKEIARALARNGFRVFGTVRNVDTSNVDLANVHVLQLDVRDEASARSCVHTVVDEAGRIDVLVNNAGYTLIGALEETTMEEARALFETNFFGTLRMNRAVLPIMRKQAYGCIINIGSAAGFVPAPYQGIYSASKHALEGYSESLDHEVRQFGIRVSVVEPGFTRTNIDRNAQVARDLLPVYTKDREHVMKAVHENNTQGADPTTVATVVLKAIGARSPRLLYLAGGDAKLVSRLRKFAPSGLFDKGLRKQFGLAGA